MKKLLLALCCLLSALARAEIQVQVQPAQISKGETFQLSLTQDSVQFQSVPDLTVLQKDFIILGTAKNVNYSIINGQSQSSIQWIVTLQAKDSGIFTIPAIKMGKERSQPLTINVSDAAATRSVAKSYSQSNSDEDVLLLTELDTKKPYLNQEITYKVALYNRKRLIDAQYQAPKVDNALLISLGDPKRYQATRNGKEYLVEEQTYAIFPQKSGSLKISSPVFSAMVYDFNPQRIRVKDKDVTLKVRPIPKDYTGTTWLPAKLLSLSERYDQSNQSMIQGSTLVRTITIEGEGIPAQLIPSLSFEDAKEYSVYTEKGKENNSVIAGVLRGSVTVKVTYLFKQPGKITLPKVKLTWFNTNTGKEERATLPSKKVDILPSVVPSSNISGDLTPVLTNSPHFELNKTNQWPWLLALIFACAWFITLVLWGMQRKSRSRGKRQYKKALAQLNKSCKEGNAQAARDALLTWASLHWPDATMMNLTDLSALVRDVHLQKQLHHLSQVLYKDDEKYSWHGDELARTIQTLSRSKGKEKIRHTNPLPPINPAA